MKNYRFHNPELGRLAAIARRCRAMMAGTPVASAGNWLAAPNNVFAGSSVATDSAAGQAGAFRGLVSADLPAGFAVVNAIAGLSALIRIAAGSSSITGITGGAINSGLTTVLQVIVSLAGAASSGVAGVTASPITSTGWFSASVFGVTSTAGGVFVSTAAGVVNWIAIGT